MKNENTTEINYIQEDEIDLRELYRTIMASKKLVITVTLLITLVASLYVFFKTPLYEAKTLIEIGNYKISNNNNNNNNNIVLLNNPSQLLRKLQVIFIDLHKNDKDKKSKITNISVPKKSNTFLEITALGISNELAIEEIKKLVQFIQEDDQKILTDVKMRREAQIHNIDTQILNIKEKEVKFTDKKISLQQKALDNYTHQLSKIDKNLQELKEKRPELAALLLMEKRNLSDSILSINLKIVDMKNEKEKLLTTKTNKLIETKNKLQSMLLPYNYKNSQVVGKILTNEYPVKPKKKLIIIVSFITGLILSIFLVFFLSFIKNDENS